MDKARVPQAQTPRAVRQGTRRDRAPPPDRPRRAARARAVTQAEFELLAELRHWLRQFSTFSEKAAHDVGLTSAQHQALLAIKGSRAPGPVSIGDLAGRLLIRHHSAVGLVDRLIASGLVRRAQDSRDRRRVNLVVGARGETVLARLAASHRDELHRIGPHVESLLVRLRAVPPAKPGRARPPEKAPPVPPKSR